MPPIRQMFPSKFLQPEDLPQGRMTAVTIAKVVAMQAVYNVQTDQMETTWLIRFAEFAKPVKLKSGLARIIGEVVRDENTDNWIGERIHIHPGTIEAWGKQIPVICVAPTRPGPSSRELVAGHGAGPRAPRGPIDPKRVFGQVGVTRFLARCAEFQVALPTFLDWLKDRDVELAAACVGRPIEMYPAACIPAMSEWFDELHEARQAPAAPPPPAATGVAAGEVVDRSTGEIKSAPPGSLAPPAPLNSIGTPASEEDIPF